MCDKYKLEIELLEGELWWGGSVDDGTNMPYGKDDCRLVLDPLITENQAMPLLISNKGRYIWSEYAFNFALLGNKLSAVSSKGKIIMREGYSNLKGAYLAASENHFAPQGGIPESMLFKYPQYNTWIELMYDQREEKIIEYAEKIIEEGLPTGVIMIDDNWQEDYGVWEFHTERFKNPKKMVDRLHELGFKVMLWVCPFVSPDSATSRLLAEKGLLLKDQTGELAVRKWWNGFSTVLDLTNPEAVLWYNKELNNLMIKYGIDGFKFDAGDIKFYRDNDIATEIVSAHDHCKSFSKVGLNYPLNEYRASWKMSGYPLVQRLCDKKHSWAENGLASLIPNGLAQGLMGYYYTCPDMIGGGQFLDFLPGTLSLDEELVVRYAQCSALFPMMQFSAAPWRVLSKENFEYCKEAAILHEQFGDYILELAKKASVTGEPIMRHMAYSFGCDFDRVNDQFMLGDEILVAPVLNKGETKRKVVFPKGIWQGDDGSIVEGPDTKEINAPLKRLPYYRLKK